MAPNILLLLGYGPRVGKDTASKFASQGYKVAIAGRSLETGMSKETGYFQVHGDFSDASTIPSVFNAVEKEFGTPNVVIYNAAVATFSSPDDPLAPAVADFEKAIHVNYVGVVAAAKEAIRGFRTLDESTSKVFFYTGNTLNDPAAAMPALLSLAAGKVASSYVIRDSASAYANQGFKFYYLDERSSTGVPVANNISGEAHAEEFWDLTQTKEQLSWLHTFVKGQGYVKF